MTLSTWIWYTINSHKKDESFEHIFTLIKCFKIPGDRTSVICLLWYWCHTVGINLLLKGASGNIDSSKNQYLYKTVWHPQMGIDYWMACINPRDLSQFQLPSSEKCTVYPVKYAPGCVVFCFIIVISSIHSEASVNSLESLYFGHLVDCPVSQWSNTERWTIRWGALKCPYIERYRFHAMHKLQKLCYIKLWLWFEHIIKHRNTICICDVSGSPKNVLRRTHKFPIQCHVIVGHINGNGIGIHQRWEVFTT